MRERSALWFALFNAFVAGSAEAQASRTWVSGTGDDAFPCSRTAPCKTFNGAFSKTATNGEISVLDPAGFGAVTITRSVTIDGRGATGVIFANLTTGVTINLTDAADTAKTVRLRGLSMNGGGSGLTGIKVVAAKRVSIEETVIDGFTQDGVAVASADSVRVFLQGGTIRNNAGKGLSVSGAGNRTAISGVTLVYNGTGIAAAAGGDHRLVQKQCVLREQAKRGADLASDAQVRAGRLATFASRRRANRNPLGQFKAF